MLGDNTDIGKDRHEIGVTTPSGNNVKVQMIGNSGTGNFPQIHPDIKPLR